jgi:hypothetical protein
MEERYGRNEKTEASTEGDLAHELAALYLKENIIISTTANGQAKFTEEMYEGAKYYFEIFKKFVSNLADIHIEEKIDISDIHLECWGTPDAWAFDLNDNSSTAIHVFDYKFGFTPIEIYENWQLLEYTCGIVKKIEQKLDKRIPDCTTPISIYLHIIQPRDFNSGSKHRLWHLTLQELESYRQRLVISEALSMSPNAPLKVSAECKYCPARHACPALQQAAFGATEVAFRDAPQGLDPRHVGSELKLLHEARDLLDFRITALETEVTHHLMNGTPVDHYELTSKYGNLNWSADRNELLALGDILGVNLRKEDIITPTQAIKLGMDETIVKSYSERKQSLKLNRIDFKKSKEVFKK